MEGRRREDTESGRGARPWTTPEVLSQAQESFRAYQDGRGPAHLARHHNKVPPSRIGTIGRLTRHGAEAPASALRSQPGRSLAAREPEREAEEEEEEEYGAVEMASAYRLLHHYRRDNDHLRAQLAASSARQQWLAQRLEHVVRTTLAGAGQEKGVALAGGCSTLDGKTDEADARAAHRGALPCCSSDEGRKREASRMGALRRTLAECWERSSYLVKVLNAVQHVYAVPHGVEAGAGCPHPKWRCQRLCLQAATQGSESVDAAGEKGGGMEGRCPSSPSCAAPGGPLPGTPGGALAGSRDEPLPDGDDAAAHLLEELRYCERLCVKLSWMFLERGDDSGRGACRSPSEDAAAGHHHPDASEADAAATDGADPSGDEPESERDEVEDDGALDEAVHRRAHAGDESGEPPSERRWNAAPNTRRPRVEAEDCVVQ